MDSVAMVDLFAREEGSFGIAHCNFGLRGEESDADAEFVESLARQYRVPFHLQSFDTKGYAKGKGISVQMAARELRYSWFDELCHSGNYRYVATAHNQDDVFETFFINLGRGTGIRGLSGIPVKSGRIIRPLLFASRQQIEQYSRERNLVHREDSSNATEKYLRNKIRHKLLPLMEEQNPSFRKTLAETMSRLMETERIFSEEISTLRKELLQGAPERQTIAIDALMKLESRQTILFEILSDYQFNNTQVSEILNSLPGPPGKQFLSPTHRIVKDREQLILTPLKDEEKLRYYLEGETGQVYEPIDLEWMILPRNSSFKIPADPDIACLDPERIEFPLLLRQWKKGDYFCPLGMQKHKKLSDFLIDEKVSLADKDTTWILQSADDIVWVIGHRIDDRYKITEDSRKILMLKFRKQ